MSKYIDDEKLRLETVKKFAIFENGRDVNLDEITRTAALICNSKFAFISIIDDQLIRFISKYGFDLTESVREKSGCDIVIKTKKSLIIDDASKVGNEKINSFYTDKVKLLSYAGFPLITNEGVVIGTLSVADLHIKTLTESQILTLETFAKQIIRNLEINKTNMELELIKNQFTAVQDICNVGHWELHIESGQVDWTSGIYKIHGVDEGVPFDKSTAISYYAPHERERILSILAKSIESGIEFNEDFEFINEQGGDMWVRSNGRAVRDKNGKIVKLVGTFQDITNIRIQEKSKEFILETMKVGTYEWDIIENIVEWDDSNYNVYGINKEDFKSPFEAWEDRIHPDWKEKTMADLQSALEGKSEYITTFGINTSEGEVRFIGGRGEIKRDENGKPISMIGINWDKTAEHKALIELEKQKAITFHRDKLASLGSLAAGVGHEINNPMAIIQGHCDFLKNRLSKDGLKMDQVSNSLEHIERSVERVSSIVKGLKNISRQDGEDFEDFEVNDVIEESVSALSDIYANVGIDIKLDIKDNLITLGNRGRIQQVIINLLSNAKDAVEFQENKIIEISIYSCSEDSIMIKVKDSGSGIPSNIQGKVFDPFFTSKEVSKGTGIGLSLCHQIISDHKGTINFETCSDQGTTFIVKLPKSKVKICKVPEQTEDKIFKDSTNCCRILIAEDEKGIQDVITILLEDIGFEVVVKNNGLEAYNEYMSNKDKYDLVLSDIQMPLMSGLQLFDKLNIEDSQRLPFVIMTGGVNQKDEELSKQVDGVITKPFTRDTLERELQRVLSLKNEKKWAS